MHTFTRQHVCICNGLSLSLSLCLIYTQIGIECVVTVFFLSAGCYSCYFVGHCIIAILVFVAIVITNSIVVVVIIAVVTNAIGVYWSCIRWRKHFTYTVTKNKKNKNIKKVATILTIATTSNSTERTSTTIPQFMRESVSSHRHRLFTHTSKYVRTHIDVCVYVWKESKKEGVSERGRRECWAIYFRDIVGVWK